MNSRRREEDECLVDILDSTTREDCPLGLLIWQSQLVVSIIETLAIGRVTNDIAKEIDLNVYVSVVGLGQD